MRTRLIVMRHAKSSRSDASLDDHDRPLNKRGRRDAPRIAQELHDREWIPDRIRVSSSKRTMETLELMKVISRNSTIDVEPSLYHSNISTLLQAVEQINPSLYFLNKALSIHGLENMPLPLTPFK